MLLLPLLFAVKLASDQPQVLYRQPQLAADGRQVVLVFGAGNAVYAARSTDQGQHFSAPVKVAEQGHLSLGMHRGPRVAVTPQAIVVSAIAGEKGGGADGDLLAWRSTDGGQTWSRPARVNDVPGAAREGLHAMAGQGSLLYAAWLDLRTKGTRLYGSVSRDSGATWSANKLIYESPSGTICQCCHPTVTLDGHGGIWVMFRNSVEGARDLYVTHSADGGKTFSPAQKQGTGTWMLNACPMDGGALTVNAKGQLTSIWRREKQIYLSAENSRETLLGDGKDPQLAATARGAYAAWTRGTQVVAQGPGQAQPSVVDTEGAYIQLLPLPGGEVLAAWESKGAIVVQPLAEMPAQTAHARD